MARKEDFVKANFIDRKPTRNETLAVANTSLLVSDLGSTGFSKRTLITIRNTSTNANEVITINFGTNAAVANQGVVLRQNESVTDADDGAYECYQGNINAICAVAGPGQLSIFER